MCVNVIELILVVMRNVSFDMSQIDDAMQQKNVDEDSSCWADSRAGLARALSSCCLDKAPAAFCTGTD